jgi:hypothetical protein
LLRSSDKGTRTEAAGNCILSTHPDFRRAYLANAVSHMGNAFQFVTLMWFTASVFRATTLRASDVPATS